MPRPCPGCHRLDPSTLVTPGLNIPPQGPPAGRGIRSLRQQGEWVESFLCRPEEAEGKWANPRL